MGSSGSGTITGILDNTTNSSIPVVFNITARADNGCVTTTTATVIVDAPLVAPVVSATQLMCIGQTPAPLIGTALTGGHGAITYQWQRSSDGGTTWTNVGTNSLTYQPPGNSALYKLIATNSCGSVESNDVQIAYPNSDWGLSFNGVRTPATGAICNSETFSYHIESGSIRSFFSDQYIKYSWQAQNPTYIPSGPVNPYGDTRYLIPILNWFPYYVGDATFSVNNPTNGVLNTNVYITPKVFNPDGGLLCNLSSVTVPVTINPTATVNNIANQSVCHNSNTVAVNFSSPTTGGTITYSWSNNQPSIGLAASGSGNIASFNAKNTGNTPIIATIQVTPSITTGGTTCAGTPKSFTITVNPAPTVTAAPATGTICSGSQTNISLSSN